MANLDQPSGFRPSRHYNGGLVRANAYKIASALGSNIFTGDLVKSTGTTKRITVAAAGDRVVGAFAGCSYLASDGSVVYNNYWPTGTVTKGSGEADCMVYDDPGILFHAQYAGTLAETDIGQTADMVSTHAGSTSTGLSGQEVDAVAQAGLKIIDYVRDGKNEVGEWAKVLVLINEHENGPTAGLQAV